jgi:hypothetical protein
LATNVALLFRVYLQTTPKLLFKYQQEPQ